MHNTYISSNLLSLTPRGSLSFSFNDYSSLLNQGFERNPCSSHCCSCCSRSCCCCSSCSCCSSSFNVQRVPIYPSLLYGLRQSTLIQCAPSRKLILSGRNRVYYRAPTYGVDHECYEVSCSFKEKGGSEKVERRSGRGRERFKSVNSSRTRCLGGVDDFEAVISLLSEELSEEYIGGFDRSGIVSKRVEIEERGSYGSEGRKGRKKNATVKLGLVESGSKNESKSARVESRKKDCSRKEDREGGEESKALSRRENRKGRAVSSSFSSYYSLDSTGDFESDMEAREEHGDVLEESSSGYKKRLRQREDRLYEQVVEEQKEHSVRAERKGEVLGHGTSETRTGVEWDLRKKSEKKLTEIEENISRKESSQVHSRMASTHESDYRKASSAHSQIDDKEEKTLAVNVEEGAKKQYSHSGSQVQKESEFRRTYQGVTDVEEIQGTNVETAPQRQKQFIGREDKLILGADLGPERREERHKIVHGSAGEGNLQRNIQKFIDVTETGDNTNITSNLQRHSESRMKIREEDRVLSSLQETNVQRRRQVGEEVTELTKARSSQRVLEASGIEESNIKRTTVLQEETRMKNLVGSTSAIYGSGTEAKEQGTQTDQKALQGFQYRQGSQDVKNLALNVTTISLVHASNTETVNISHGTSEKSTVEQRSQSASFTKPILERKDRNDQTDENAALVKSRKEALLASKTSSFREEASPSSQTYLSSSSLGDVQQSDAGEGNLRSPQEMMKPPSPQLITIGSLHVDQATGISIEMIDTEPSESSPSAFYTNSGGITPASHQQTYGSDREGELYGEPLDLPVHEDTLGSAHRLEESSGQFVGEFIEKARHGLSTSGIQKETTVSDTKLASKSENEGPKSSGHGSGKVQMKDQDSRKSSGGSGAKGPSDEMWDVLDPSVQEPPETPETEAPEDRIEPEDIVVKRTGNALWGVIGKIFRMRWGSLGETPTSTKRSGGKSSSNDSVSSEAWFSGREHDETSDETVKKGKKSMRKEAVTFPQLQQVKMSREGRSEAFDTSESEDRIRKIEADTTSASQIIRSGSTSKAISLPSEGKNVGWSRGGSSSQVVNSGVEAGEPLPSSSRHAAIVEENSGADKADVSLSGSTEREQPLTANLTEGSVSDGKDVVLRQRRLQRNKQVVRDKFDEWEEAYIHENEQRKVDEMFMREALLEAKKAADSWEVPVGAVLVQHGKIIARGCNLVEELRDSTAHAEMICIREASNQLRSWRLSDTTLYVTLEPCPMCAGAILQARVDIVVWGAPNKLLGADGSWIRLFPNGGGNDPEVADKPSPPVHPFHPNMKIRRGILASECADAMQQFFQLRRRKKKVEAPPSPPQPSCLPITHPQPKILKHENVSSGLAPLPYPHIQLHQQRQQNHEGVQRYPQQSPLPYPHRTTPIVPEKSQVSASTPPTTTTPISPPAPKAAAVTSPVLPPPAPETPPTAAPALPPPPVTPATPKEVQVPSPANPPPTPAPATPPPTPVPAPPAPVPAPVLVPSPAPATPPPASVPAPPVPVPAPAPVTPPLAPVPAPLTSPPALAPEPVLVPSPAPAPHKHKRRRHKHKWHHHHHHHALAEAPLPPSPPSPSTLTTEAEDTAPAPAPSEGKASHQHGGKTGKWITTAIAIASLLVMSGYSF